MVKTGVAVDGEIVQEQTTWPGCDDLRAAAPETVETILTAFIRSESDRWQPGEKSSFGNETPLCNYSSIADIEWAYANVVTRYNKIQ